MRLGLCCEGADIKISEPAEPKEHQTEPHPKSRDASVFPAKRKSVKKMACNCFIHRICGNLCFNTAKSKTRISLCSCSPPQPNHLCVPGNYGNETKGALCKWQMK